MKTKAVKRNTVEFLPDREKILQDSIESLRNSFEIEGVFFTDVQIKAMVDKVFADKKLTLAHQ